MNLTRILVLDWLAFLLKMGEDLKSRMDQDLSQKLNSLFVMRMQPALHLSKWFDDVINKIDYDAELIMMGDGAVTYSPDSTESPAATSKVNEARCEFIRILKLLEQNMQTQLLANETKEPGKVFAILQERVKEIRSTPFSSKDDINDLEDSYVGLVLEIREMARAEESKIFGNQTIFYLNSRRPSELGSVFHLTGVFLTSEEIDFLK